MPFIPAKYDSGDPRMRFDNPNLFWDLGLWVPESNSMNDAIIKLEVDELDDAALLALAKKHKNGLAGNPAVFTDGAPYIATIDPLITLFEGKLDAIEDHKQAGKTLTQQKNAVRADLRRELKTGGKYVALKAKGDGAIHLLGGFDNRADGTPPEIVAPTGLNGTYGDVSGSISAHFNPVKNAVAYLIGYRVANSNAPFQLTPPFTASNYQVTGLIPGELYELNVCAVFAGPQAGPGPACSTIEHRAA